MRMSRRGFLRCTGSGILLGSLGSTTTEAVPSSSDREAEHPNVLLILCDDLNDYCGAFGGHPQARTPNVDRLAREATVFTNAHSNTPVCSPSRNSMFCGVYSHRSGDFAWTPHFEQPVLKHCKTMMEYFRENGYHVMGSGKLLHVNQQELWDEWGVDVNNYGPFSFDGENWVGHPSVPRPFRDIGAIDGSFAPLSDVPKFPDAKAVIHEPGWTDGKGRPFKYVDEDNRDLCPDERHAQWAAKRIQELADSDSDKPFFMGVGFVRPHTPLHAPKKFFDMFPLDEIELEPIKENDAEDCHYLDIFPADSKGPRYFRTLKESYPDIETGLRHFVQAYLACIAFVDEQIGVVMDALDKTRFKRNTVVVFTSDNGWQMGEKDYLFKNSPWEESTRIPLVVRAPGVARPGSRVDHPVSLIDVFPTLIDLCNLQGDVRKSEAGVPMDGFSLRPFLRDGNTGRWNGPEGALSLVGNAHYLGRTEPLEQSYSYRTKDWRYIRYSHGAEELYDHRNDPYEWHSLATDEKHAKQKNELKAQMMQLVNGDSA
jgi:arylsulfatase A-like enzyme